MKDDIIEFKGENEEEIKIEMQVRHQELAILLVKKIIWALDNNIDEFILAMHEHDGFLVGVKRDNYLEALEKNLEKMENYEEYELCKKSIEWIDYLKIEEKTNVNKR